MRVRNMRLVIVGAVMVAGAVAFFLYFLLAMRSQSNDPAAMMQAVGQVSGVVGFLGALMAAIGFIGKKA